MSDTDRLAALLHMIEDPNVGNGPSLKQQKLAARLIAAGVTLAPTPPDALREAAQVVSEQAEDEGLWFIAETAAEAYLQQELRRLHAAIEGDPMLRRNRGG